MERLAGVDEILDGPLEDIDAVAGNLRDLRRVNRLLGGTRLSRIAILRLCPGELPLELLDVGTGGGGMALPPLGRGGGGQGSPPGPPPPPPPRDLAPAPRARPPD